MARVRTIIRHVATCLRTRADIVRMSEQVKAVFPDDGEPVTDVPGDGVSLIRWAYRAKPEERDTSLIRRIDTNADYFYRAGTILSTLMSWRDRVPILDALRYVELWIRDNTHNLGGEPYEESHRAELKTEAYHPPYRDPKWRPKP